jgi:hypothetical protein
MAAEQVLWLQNSYEQLRNDDEDIKEGDTLKR